jgi:hypothetical protein
MTSCSSVFALFVASGIEAINMFNTFYVHKNRGPGKLPNREPRGFTLMVAPHANERLVECRGAFCSPKDQFSKKEGRLRAKWAKAKLIKKRELPHLLYAMDAVAKGDTTEKDWLYVLKYVV